MTFEEVWARYKDEIRRLSLTQTVMGMDSDDVHSEMSIALWKAWRTYMPERGSFGKWWWSVWLNRRSDINEAYYAVKRVEAVPVDIHSPVFDRPAAKPVTIPEAPRGSGAVETTIWHLLAEGSTAKQVQQTAGITRRRYYEVLARFRTKEVKDDLERTP